MWMGACGWFHHPAPPRTTRRRLCGTTRTPCCLVVGAFHHVPRAHTQRLVRRFHRVTVGGGRRLGGVTGVGRGRGQGGQAPALAGIGREHLGRDGRLGRRVAHHLQGLGRRRIPVPDQVRAHGGVLLYDLSPQQGHLKRVALGRVHSAQRAAGSGTGNEGRWVQRGGEGRGAGRGGMGR